MGQGQSLLGVENLTPFEIKQIINRAHYFQNYAHDMQKIKAEYKNHFVANLFIEPSTRTRFSFEVAEKKLGVNVLNFQNESSSMTKGETLYDTLKTFESLGVDAAVIRLSEEGILQSLESKLKLKIVNAGDGKREHPTQALLDLYTVKKYFADIKGLNVAIIGDIKHSRVARSNSHLLKKLGANIIYSGPENLQAEDLDGEFMPINRAIKEADVVIMLRIQFERQDQRLVKSKEEYNLKYGFTKERLRYLKPNAIILHPAPVNRGVEIDDEIVEHPQSKIFEQIQNGVWIRMAVIERALGGKLGWNFSSNKEQYGSKIIGMSETY